MRSNHANSFAAEPIKEDKI
jgi:hypothetical protein